MTKRLPGVVVALDVVGPVTAIGAFSAADCALLDAVASANGLDRAQVVRNAVDFMVMVVTHPDYERARGRII